MQAIYSTIIFLHGIYALIIINKEWSLYACNLYQSGGLNKVFKSCMTILDLAIPNIIKCNYVVIGGAVTSIHATRLT